jgi:hypothetical protein
LNRNDPSHRRHIVEHLVVGNIGANFREDIQIRQNRTPVDGYVHQTGAGGRIARIGFGEFQGHLIVPRWNVEGITEGAVTLAGVEGGIGGSRDSPLGDGVSARKVLVSGPEISQ